MNAYCGNKALGLQKQPSKLQVMLTASLLWWTIVL